MLLCPLSLFLRVVMFFLFLLSHVVWLFLGSPGDTVLLSSLMNWHGQNESSCMLPKTTLCPQGGLAGYVCMRPVVSLNVTGHEHPLASHRLNRIMQLYLNRQAWSMGLMVHANSCQRCFNVVKLIPAAYLHLSKSLPHPRPDSAVKVD